MLKPIFVYLTKICVLVLSATLFNGIIQAESLPEFIKAEIAVQLREEGHMTNEIGILRLSCFEGECEINTTVINRCIKLIGGEKIQRIFSFVEKSTDPNTTFEVNGNKVDVTVVSQSSSGKILTTYHFELVEKEMIEGQKVEKFSGGYVKDSNITNSLIKVEFIPLIGDYHKINLTCPIEVQGLIRTNIK